MAALQKQPRADRRREKRYELTRGIQAKLYIKQKNQYVQVSIVNVSKSGICVREPESLPDTADVYLILNGRRLALNSVWAVPDSGQSRSNLHSFAAAKQGTNFLSELTRAGLSLSQAVEQYQSEEEQFVNHFLANGITPPRQVASAAR